ncbi:hypothetical protein AWJ26_gp61 (endogenous virus) [Sinorhizobium phage phiLM21]|uniref:hypothetical protein n=1 Tax=Sinorhizobium phage phiLM21 TaxID=1524882 RepID=UPI0004E5C4FC|nr:hypothetical protein AWJ26_gp61 [Sinorhizobium phage phiLM21]AII27799.1 hypothetical protein phiLM21_p048 [Sinorhizobium phage phiLM21]
MKLRFVKAYTQFKVGDTVDDTQVGGATMAKGLINLGLAEEMPEEKPAKAEKGAKE